MYKLLQKLAPPRLSIPGSATVNVISSHSGPLNSYIFVFLNYNIIYIHSKKDHSKYIECRTEEHLFTQVVNPSIGGIALPAYKKISPAKKNLLKTMVMVTLVFVLCLSWDQIMWLLYVVGVTKTYYGNLFYYSFMLTCINSCINPFIYIIHYKEFKAGIKKLLNKSSSIVMPWSTQSTFST